MMISSLKNHLTILCVWIYEDVQITFPTASLLSASFLFGMMFGLQLMFLAQYFKEGRGVLGLTAAV